jgi:hypothetical protein
MTKRNKGLMIASAAAALFLAGAVEARAESHTEAGGEVYCKGINSCKGQSVCATDKHSCAGQNSCKGAGVIKSTDKECADKGGTVVPKP